ncbi:hypothetical protein Lal_00028225 [Lupinus albus]|nr:hypothetical protein Lal_00028225 [Lupinus albus]
MTRRNTCILHSINPEIDRTYHRLVRQNRTLDTNFVSVLNILLLKILLLSILSVHSEYSDSVHSVAFPNFDHSVHSENMAQPPTLLFNGLAGQDPHKHLKEFHIVCSTMKPNDVMEDNICLKAFLIHLKALQRTGCTIWLLVPSQVGVNLKRSFWVNSSLHPGPLQSERTYLELSNNMVRACMSTGRGLRDDVLVPYHQISEQLLL